MSRFNLKRRRKLDAMNTSRPASEILSNAETFVNRMQDFAGIVSIKPNRIHFGKSGKRKRISISRVPNSKHQLLIRYYDVHAYQNFDVVFNPKVTTLELIINYLRTELSKHEIALIAFPESFCYRVSNNLDIAVNTFFLAFDEIDTEKYDVRVVTVLKDLFSCLYQPDLSKIEINQIIQEIANSLIISDNGTNKDNMMIANFVNKIQEFSEINYSDRACSLARDHFIKLFQGIINDKPIHTLSMMLTDISKPEILSLVVLESQIEETRAKLALIDNEINPVIKEIENTKTDLESEKNQIQEKKNKLNELINTKDIIWKNIRQATQECNLLNLEEYTIKAKQINDEIEQLQHYIEIRHTSVNILNNTLSKLTIEYQQQLEHGMKLKTFYQEKIEAYSKVCKIIKMPEEEYIYEPNQLDTMFQSALDQDESDIVKLHGDEIKKLFDKLKNRPYALLGSIGPTIITEIHNKLTDPHYQIFIASLSGVDAIKILFETNNINYNNYQRIFNHIIKKGYLLENGRFNIDTFRKIVEQKIKKGGGKRKKSKLFKNRN